MGQINSDDTVVFTFKVEDVTETKYGKPYAKLVYKIVHKGNLGSLEQDSVTKQISYAYPLAKHPTEEEKAKMLETTIEIPHADIGGELMPVGLEVHPSTFEGRDGEEITMKWLYHPAKD